jgi:hypothetical protein
MKPKLILWLAAMLFCTATFAQTGFPFDNEIRDYKHQDSLHMPEPGGFLFIGSSSIRKWTDLDQRFPGQPIIKRGVGGSELWQWIKYYMPYVVYPYQPAKIFLYAGENDIAGGRTAKQVTADFIQFWNLTRQHLPKAEIYFMSIKMSPVRAKSYNEVLLADQLIKDFLKGRPHGHYIDVNTVLFDAKTSLPDSSLFSSDYLHLNSKGYDRWEKVLRKNIHQ